MKNTEDVKRKRDYRHYILIGITVLFCGCGFLFPNALPRLAESVRDVFTSIAYYFCELTLEENPIPATVTSMPSWKFVDTGLDPLRILPETWEKFKVAWGVYWDVFFTKENITGYFRAIGDGLYYLSKFLLIVMPFILALILYLRRYTEVHNNDYNVDSGPLKAFKKFSNKVIFPTVRWVKSFVQFIRENDLYFKTWILLWLIYFNFFPILFDAIAFYLYFVVSFDFIGIYYQLLKLLYDITPVVRFIPGVIWIILLYVGFEKMCREQADAQLRHNERKNRGFINERGVVTIVYGSMGVGKTALITSTALSAEVDLRDMAFEVLLECDMMFPNFPWVNLRNAILDAVDRRQIVDIPSARRWVRRAGGDFDYLIESKNLKWYKRQLQKRDILDVTFDYDVMTYALDYSDELQVTDLYSAIEDYTCAYFIYTIQTSLIISNYSIRTDNIISDLGNFPLWDSDFFERDPRLMDAYSRHSHIIDFDMLRLGKRMLEDNPNRNAFGFGVYVVSEIDKERKNALELKETKINTDECNQRNDLFNSCLKMSRHACVIRNRVFLKILCDLQRPEDWGAGGREVGEVVFISDKGDLAPALPFYSTYWLVELIFMKLKSSFDRFYVKYIYQRGDNTLLVYLLKNTVAALSRYFTKTNNRYGTQTLHLQVESARMDGEPKERKYYRMPKKDFAKRYTTNCLSAIFEGDEVNTVSISDFCEYADILATSEELAMQHSHFQRDISRMKSSKSKE